MLPNFVTQLRHVEDSPMKTFGKIYRLRYLIKEPTCFQNPDNPTCTDLILTDKPLSFRSTYVIETELSDFHKINDSSCDENTFS